MEEAGSMVNVQNGAEVHLPPIWPRGLRTGEREKSHFGRAIGEALT